MIPVSACLIVHNEEDYIERALRSVLWCDEIIVVDSKSGDRTREICIDPKSPWSNKIRFHDEPWRGFSAQRNFAMTLAANDWIFFLDGDEACTEALRAKLQNLLRNGPGLFHYKIRRQEYFLGRPIHGGTWNPSYHIRFFNRTRAKYIKEIHEDLKTEGTKLEAIEEPISHNQDLRVERILDKMNRYTTIETERDFNSGVRTNFLRIFLAFPAMFLKNYFYLGAWRDGVSGIIISVLEGISRTVRQIKLWQIQQLNGVGAEPWWKLWRGHSN